MHTWQQNFLQKYGNSKLAEETIYAEITRAGIKSKRLIVPSVLINSLIIRRFLSDYYFMAEKIFSL